LNAQTASRPTLHWTVAFIATGLAYAVAGLGAGLLAFPPGYASPLYPSAGIALVCVIVFGRRMLPAVALGAFAINLWLSRCCCRNRARSRSSSPPARSRRAL